MSGRTVPGGRWICPGRRCPMQGATWGADLLAAMADGRILHSADRGETWLETGVRIGSILAMAVA